LGHPAIIFGKKFEQPQEKRNGTSEKKVSYKKFPAIGLSELNPSLNRAQKTKYVKKKLRESDLPHLLLKWTPYHRAMATPLNRMPQRTVGSRRVARFGRAGRLWRAVASVLNS
jgi:hypothetical protein